MSPVGSRRATYYAANIIANPTLTVAGRTVDATTIDADLLRSLHEVDEVEANVSTGYHAIEFLLWGQDLNGTGPGASQRPASDFMAGAGCTGGNCDRRRAYLMAATDLLIADLVADGRGGPAVHRPRPAPGHRLPLVLRRPLRDAVAS